MPAIDSKRHGFTLVELLVVIAIISIIAGLVVPILIEGRGRANAVTCISNLRQIGGVAMSYSNKRSFFPYDRKGEGRAHESLNMLLKSRHGRMLRATPEIFQCPEAAARVVQTDEQGRTVVDELGEDVCYTWTSEPVKNTTVGAFLSSDKYYEGYEDEDGKHNGHNGFMVVLKTDGSVTEMEVDDLLEDTGLPVGLTR